MLTNKLRIFISVLAIFAAMRAGAQTSLGDPVLNETFGIGGIYTYIGPELKPGVTDLPYVKNRCPGTGSYTIASGTSACFADTWISLDDHTRTSDFGYMMLINASAAPSIFYTYKIAGNLLCPGANYQFEISVKNLINDKPETANDARPNIHFKVKNARTGQIIDDSYNSGDIPQDASWHNPHMDFFAPADGSDLIIELSNNTPGDYGNDFAMDDITVKAIGPTLPIGFTTPEDNTARNLCVDNGTTPYNLVAQPADVPTAVYQWQSNFNNTGWNNIPGATAPFVHVDVPHNEGKYQYRLGMLSAPGVSENCRTFSAPLTVTVNALPTFDLPATTNVCEGRPLDLFGNKGITYQWTGPNNFSSIEQSPRISNSATADVAGIYHLTLTGKGGCTYETQTEVKFFSAINPTVDNADLTVCEGVSVQLGANGGTIYKWEPALGLDHDNIPNPVATPSETTEYHVTIGNGGCEETRTVTVTVLKRPVANAGPDLTMQEGEPVTLKGSVIGSNINHYWTPPDNMDDPSSLTPKVNPTETTTYTLHAESPDNCGIVTDYMTVRVFKKITVPTTFTPNNDGVNDTWKIDKLITYPESSLTVYNRAGNEVFRTAGDAKQWNGQYLGKQLPAGVYYYIIDLKNNLPLRAGWVMLVR